MIEAMVLIVSEGKRKGGCKYRNETIGSRKENPINIRFRDPLGEMGHMMRPRRNS